MMTKHFNKKEMKPRRRKLRSEMTSCEKILWAQLRKKQMKVRFLRQFSIDAYVIDFYSPEIKLAIELDGGIHNTQQQKKYDKDRQSYLEAFGINFLRITNDELIGNPNKVYEQLEETIKKLNNNNK